MRREALYLRDVVEATGAIGGFLRAVDRESFLASDLVRSAVLHKLTIVGEAAARLPQEFRDNHPAVPWRDIIGFRNIAVHAYFSVDWAIVWEAATGDAPELRRQVRDILTREYPEIDLGTAAAPASEDIQ
jgi:uncharacterized protein with HEPN domain